MTGFSSPCFMCSSLPLCILHLTNVYTIGRLMMRRQHLAVRISPQRPELASLSLRLGVSLTLRLMHMLDSLVHVSIKIIQNKIYYLRLTTENIFLCFHHHHHHHHHQSSVQIALHLPLHLLRNPISCLFFSNFHDPPKAIFLPGSSPPLSHNNYKQHSSFTDYSTNVQSWRFK